MGDLPRQDFQSCGTDGFGNLACTTQGYGGHLQHNFGYIVAAGWTRSRDLLTDRAQPRRRSNPTALTRFTEDHIQRAITLLVLALVSPGAVDRAIAQAKLTKAQKIADAMKAAPRSISAKATIMDWPATEGGKMVTLRAGTNGWTCLPPSPRSRGDDPMCVDDQWMAFMNALMTKATPDIAREGIGYMTAPGGSYGSNTDPFAREATPDNDWGYNPPHVMLLVPDPRALEGIPTTRQSGGPWVMWAGTAYAHIMVPLTSPKK